MSGLHAFGPCVHIHVSLLHWIDRGYVMSIERLRLIVITKLTLETGVFSGLGHPRPFLIHTGDFFLRSYIMETVLVLGLP